MKPRAGRAARSFLNARPARLRRRSVASVAVKLQISARAGADHHGEKHQGEHRLLAVESQAQAGRESLSYVDLSFVIASGASKSREPAAMKNENWKLANGK